MKTKVVVFDAYGTLFDVNSAAEKCKDKIGAKWEAFANFWRTTQLEYTWLRSLMKRHKNFWDVTEDSLDKSMRVFNINKNMKNELLNLYKILSPYPEVNYEEVVKYFEKKHKAKIDLNTNNELNLEDYIIEFKSKTKKVLDKIEKVEKLEAIKIENIKEEDIIKNKSRKIFKKRKFRKKFYKKKTK